jgi:voltage-gated potassium channel
MNAMVEKDTALVNPNWSAFVLLVTLLSFLNSLLMLMPLPSDAKTVLGIVNLAISVILWADFIYLVRRSDDKRRFMVQERGWMVLLGSLPFMRFLRLIWFWLVLKNNELSFREFLSQIVIKRNAGGTLLFILFTVIVVFQFSVVAMLGFEETTPGGNINSISDAFWWAFATVTTVGYGDKYPVTNGGRIVAVVLMALGIALLSVITGSLAEWFSGQQQEQPELHSGDRDTAATSVVAEIQQLLEKQEETYLNTINELTARLTDLETSLEKAMNNNHFD